MERPTREARELVGAVSALTLAHLHGDLFSPLPFIAWIDPDPDFAGRTTKLRDGWRIELSNRLEGLQLAKVLAHELRHTVQNQSDDLAARELDATWYEHKFGPAFYEVAAVLDTDADAMVHFEKWAKSTPAPGDVLITETGAVRRWRAERRTAAPTGLVMNPRAPMRAAAPCYSTR